MHGALATCKPGQVWDEMFGCRTVAPDGTAALLYGTVALWNNNFMLIYMEHIVIFNYFHCLKYVTFCIKFIP